MRHHIVAAAAVVAFSCAAWGQTPQKLNLKQAEMMAIANHPLIKAATASALGAQEATAQVRSAYYPTAYGNLTGAQAENGTRLAAGALNSPRVLTKFATGVAVTQLVTDFGRTTRLIQSSALQANAQKENVVVTRADVLLAADQAYFRALKAQAVLTVAEQTVKERQLVADRVNALAKAKLKSGLDVSFAEVNLGQAKLLLVQAQNEVQAAFAELSLALGFSDQRMFQLTEEPLPPAPAPDVNPLVAQAFRERPEVVRQRYVADSARAFAVAERDLWFPTISAAGNAGVAPVADNLIRSSYAAAGFNLSIPELNFKLISARHAEASFRAQAEQEQLQNVENNVARQVRVAWLDAVTAYQRLDLTAQILAQATQAFDLSEARYKLGLSSIVELEQAQLNKTQAAIDQASANYEYAGRTAALNYAMGLLR